MTLAGLLALSYLLGSVPSAFLLARRLKGIDIRTVGSGNVGATNAMRALGRGPGLAVFAIDFGKGLLAARLPAGWLSEPIAGAALACGFAAVLGHNFPIWLGFRGGKGVATTLGVLLGSAPAVTGVAVLAWLAVFVVSRYVSLASIGAALAIPAGQWIFRRPLAELAWGSALAALILVQHRSNIRRLRRGEEPRGGHRPSSAPIAR
jgi:glycerol-3-phosphate acyltransferase PlsY